MSEYITKEDALEAIGKAYGDVAEAEDNVRAIPAADVVDGETYRNLLKAAKKMHCWIFLNAADELKAYEECGLTDEMNALLGYGGLFTGKMDGGADDAVD